MNRKQIQKQIKDLKGRLGAANRSINARLLKLTLIMVILLLAAAVIYGRIQL